MARAKIPYYVVKRHTRIGYWQPTKAMVAAGARTVVCGPDGPEAWAKAAQAYRDWMARKVERATAEIVRLVPKPPEETVAATELERKIQEIIAKEMRRALREHEDRLIEIAETAVASAIAEIFKREDA